MTTPILMSIIVCQIAFIGWLLNRHIKLIDRTNRKKIKRSIKEALRIEDYETAAKLRDRL